MPDEDTPEEGGLEPAAETEDPEVDASEAVEEQAEPEVYTRQQLAELLPHFDRFESHEGAKAFEEYGKAYNEARTFINSGGHKQQDEPELEEVEEDEYQGPAIFGAPWELPTTWDDYLAYANSESPEMRRLAAYGVLQSPAADQQTKQWFYNQWAAADPHGAASYIQQSSVTAAEQRLAELEARIEAKYAGVNQDLRARNASGLVELAKAQIPGFVEHAQAVEDLFNERCSVDPAFAERIMNSSTTEQQLKELRRLTILAAAEAEPERKAKQKQATDETDAAKIRSRTETSRTNGAPEDEQSALKRKSLEDARKVGHRVM